MPRACYYWQADQIRPICEERESCQRLSLFGPRKGIRMLRISTLFIVLSLIVGCAYQPFGKRDSTPSADQIRITQWKSRQLSVMDFSGKSEEKWVKINFREGDEIWYFISPPPTWEHKMGREGYAIFRKGNLVAKLITRMN